MRPSPRSRAKYPLATISAYGPENRRATKLVVGILHRAGQKEANLTFTISVLRKALGDSARTASYIETVPKRGYRLIAPVR